MDRTLTDIIDDLRERGYFLMPPADTIDIEQQNYSLQTISHCKIPDDYASLLEHANGIQGRGFLLYGAIEQNLAGGQRVPDLVEATLRAKDKEIISDGVMLGYAQGFTVIVFSKEFMEYQILDSLTLDVIYRYKYIEEFLIAKIKLYDKISNQNKQ